MSSQAARAASARQSVSTILNSGAPQGELRQALAELGLPAGPAMERLLAGGTAFGLPTSPTEVRDAVGRLLVAWVEGLLERPLGAPPQALAAARAAVLLSDAAARWPEHFLSAGPPLPELVQAMARALPQPVPEARPLAMPTQSLAPAETPRLVPDLRPERIARRP